MNELLQEGQCSAQRYMNTTDVSYYQKALLYLVALVWLVCAIQGVRLSEAPFGARWGPAIADFFGLVLGGAGALLFPRAYRLSKTQSKKDGPPTRS